MQLPLREERAGQGFEKSREVVEFWFLWLYRGRKSSHFWLALGKDEKGRAEEAESQGHIFSFISKDIF